MDLKECILNRRSYRHPFLDREIPEETLKEILLMAYHAPSACNMQSSHLIAVNDETILNELADLYGKEWAKTAKAAVLIASSPEKFKTNNGGTRVLEDFGATAEHILLAAVNYGLASVWIQGQIEGEIATKMAKLLNVPDDFIIYGYFPLGYPSREIVSPKKKAFEDRCFLNGWGKSFN